MSMTNPIDRVATQRTEIRVRYADTDAQGVVYHGAYFSFFEVARLDLLEQLVGTELHVPALWQRLAIRRAVCDYEGWVRFPEDLVVHSLVEKVGTSSFDVRYRLINAKGQIVAEGVTTQVYLGSNGRPAPLPPSLVERLSDSRPTDTSRRTVAPVGKAAVRARDDDTRNLVDQERSTTC